MTGFGVRSSVAQLRRVAVRAPALGSDFARAHWEQPVDEVLLLEQHAAFVRLLRHLGCTVDELPADAALPDSCFVYDPVFVAGDGAIVLRAAKDVRAGEPAQLARDLEALGVPIIGALQGDATADGGDMCFLDASTLAVGRSYRTNDDAIEQIQRLLAPQGIEVRVFTVPHDRGPEYCMHLMSVISPVRDDLAVVYERLAPEGLLAELQDRGIAWVNVPDAEYATLGCNVLAIKPGLVVLAEGNDETAMALRARAVHVHLYAASELNKGEGGPTCLTRPLLRS